AADGGGDGVHAGAVRRRQHALRDVGRVHAAFHVSGAAGVDLRIDGGVGHHGNLGCGGGVHGDAGADHGVEVQRGPLEGDSDLKPTLLIVDEERYILASLRRALEVEGYGAEVAGSGKQAVEKMSARAFDLVMCDIAMPYMGGLDVLA